MGEIRFVGTGETRGYPYLVCKKRIVGPGKTRGYPYPVCKKYKSHTGRYKDILVHLARSHSIILSARNYSRLSLSRSPRDSLKYIEIPVLRHIRFPELRKKNLTNKMSQIHM